MDMDDATREDYHVRATELLAALVQQGPAEFLREKGIRGMQSGKGDPIVVALTQFVGRPSEDYVWMSDKGSVRLVTFEARETMVHIETPPQVELFRAAFDEGSYMELAATAHVQWVSGPINPVVFVLIQNGLLEGVYSEDHVNEAATEAVYLIERFGDGRVTVTARPLNVDRETDRSRAAKALFWKLVRDRRK